MSLYIAIAVVIAVLTGGAYMKGRVDGAAEPTTQLAILNAQAERQKEHYDEVARRLQTSVTLLHERSHQRSLELARVVRAPRYRDTCLDADGLRLANEALANAAASAAATVSATDTAR